MLLLVALLTAAAAAHPSLSATKTKIELGGMDSPGAGLRALRRLLAREAEMLQAGGPCLARIQKQKSSTIRIKSFALLLS